MIANLARQMVERAEMDGLPASHRLRVLAAKLDETIAEGDAKKILGAWARARMEWCAYTGEPLV